MSPIRILIITMTELWQRYQNLFELIDSDLQVAVSDWNDDDFLFDCDNLLKQVFLWGGRLSFLWVDDFKHLPEAVDLGSEVAELLKELSEFFIVLEENHIFLKGLNGMIVLNKFCIDKKIPIAALT